MIVTPIVKEQTKKSKIITTPQKETKQMQKDKHYSEGLTLIDGTVVPDTKRNRTLLNRESKFIIPQQKDGL